VELDAAVHQQQRQQAQHAQQVQHTQLQHTQQLRQLQQVLTHKKQEVADAQRQLEVTTQQMAYQEEQLVLQVYFVCVCL